MTTPLKELILVCETNIGYGMRIGSEDAKKLLAIVKRQTEALEKLCYHEGCEDGFYACPKHEDYFGTESYKPIEERSCFCHFEPASEALSKSQELAGK